MEEVFNGIILPNKTRVSFSKAVRKIQVVDINIKNHPAFNRKGSKQVIATELIKEGEYIGSYGGEMKYCNEDPKKDRLNWNPYQLYPDSKGNYYIDGEVIGNELKYINDPKDVGNIGANAEFKQSNKTLKGFYTCEIKALRDIQPQEEILVSYGDDYWTSLQEWYERKNPFACPNCDFRTKTKYYLKEHLKRERNVSKDYECDYCNKKYKKSSNLEKHMNIHTKEIIYKCDLCEYTTFSNSIYQHKEHHHSDKIYKCFECGIKFRTSSNFKEHVNIIHKKKKPFNCDQCASSFFRKGGLKAHIEFVHEKKKPFKCNQCDYACNLKQSLKTHIDAIHEKKKPFKCNQCNYACSQKINLKAHIQRRHERKRLLESEREEEIEGENQDVLSSGSSAKKHRIGENND